MSTERELFRRRSRFQEIVLCEEDDGHINLTLDGVWQFRSQEEFIFHELLADSPIILAKNLARVLILGGGDGLAARNVLRYPEVGEVVLCELDPDVLEMTQTVPAMRQLSEDSLADPRVTVVAADALDFIGGDLSTQDVIICDFPAATRDELRELFSSNFFSRLLRLAHDDTVIATQISQDPSGFWPIDEALSHSFSWRMPLLASLAVPGAGDEEEEGWADFLVASKRPQEVRRPVAKGARFLSAERLSRLEIKNPGESFFQTLEYGEEPDFTAP